MLQHGDDDEGYFFSISNWARSRRRPWLKGVPRRQYATRATWGISCALHMHI